ncbi:hypothetical protein HMPREF9702_04592 [Delftia acidovorans CCUG 15835]|nr:hypothetical protein HMPREF9702_04592 [Delftia acidovorans CCUG 15835]KAA9173611.1 ATP-binding protein [Delftia sp. BR1]
MLNNCTYNNRKLSFQAGDYSDSLHAPNKFTVIVGRNGVGKSRLLREICMAYVDIEQIDDARISYRGAQVSREKFDIDSHRAPSSVIALSTSPFDRFPLQKMFGPICTDYQYLGLRGLSSRNLSLAFLSRTIGALITSVVDDPNHINTINEVLSHLGYYPFLEIRLVASLSPAKLEKALESNNFIEYLINNNNRVNAMSERWRYHMTKLSAYEVSRFEAACRHWASVGVKPRLDLKITKDGLIDLQRGSSLDLNFLLLIQMGFFQLRDVGVIKNGLPNPIRITDASSGEQCVVMSLLGIASHIKNGTLICIDEPEICLHPAWQEQYVSLLMNVFSKFKGCHFIIATHSPQVIAQLKDDNCFVLDLENGVTTQAAEYNLRSADYQLARLFKAPGFKNEYLSRTLIDALQALSGGVKYDQLKSHEVHQILHLKNVISPDDPIKRLMDICEKALKASQEK